MEHFISSGDGVTVRRTNVLDGSASSLDDVLAPPFVEQRTALTQLRNERLQFGVVQVVSVGGPKVGDGPACDLFPFKEDLARAGIGQQVAAGVPLTGRDVCEAVIECESFCVRREHVAQPV